MKKFSFSVIFPCLFLWSALIFLTALNVWTPIEMSHIISTFVLLVQIFTVTNAWEIYRGASGYDRNSFLWLLLAIIGFFLNGTFFYILIFVCKISIANMPPKGFFLFFIPFLIWLGFLTIFLIKILVPNILSKSKFTKILFSFMPVNAAIMALFFSANAHNFSFFSPVVISLDFSCVYRLILFDLVVLCLISAQILGFQLFLVGIAIITASAFLFDYAAIGQLPNLLVYAELSWFLGIIFMVWGLSLIKKNKNYTLKEHFRKGNSIKSRFIFWTFAVSVLSFLFFFTLAYAFSLIERSNFIGVPFFIISYSVVLLMLSIYAGKHLEIPFKKLASNVRLFTEKKDLRKLDQDFSIEEFVFLNQFVIDAFEAIEERDRAQKRLLELSARVAHDIRSPAAALIVLSEECASVLQEEDRISLREAAHTIEDIASNLLAEYGPKGGEHAKGDGQALLVSALVLQILAEKRLQFKGKDVRFEHSFDQRANFAFVAGNAIEFKRMVSNVINNAVDACVDRAGVIVVSLQFSKVGHRVTLSVRDNGKGMPAELIDKIMKAEAVTVGKKEGHGIGLGQVRQTLGDYRGEMNIVSTPGGGTEVCLNFPVSVSPDWMAQRVELDPTAIVLIVDDDASIHTAWDHRFKKVVAESSALKVMHFREGEAAIQFVSTLTEADRKRLFLLTDYELLNQAVNGLDVLEATQIKHSVLVTSHYAEEDVMERAAQLGAKILPKLLVVDLPILLATQVNDEAQPAEEKRADVIIVDDKPQFMKLLIRHYLKGKAVAFYSDPYQFLTECEGFAKTTPICLDDDLGLTDFNGRDLAKQLHAMGFLKLYLISGREFDDLPPYLTAMDKNAIGTVLDTP